MRPSLFDGPFTDAEATLLVIGCAILACAAIAGISIAIQNWWFRRQQDRYMERRSRRHR